MNQPEIMYRLQETELGIVRAQQRLKQITDLLANDELVQQAQRQRDAAEGVLSPLKVRLKNLEHDLQANESKTRATDEQLYSGTIRNPKEMQDMQQEIEALKRWHGELENMLLETMLNGEEAQAALDEAEAHLAAVVASRGDEHRALLDEQIDLRAQVEQLKQQRQEILRDIAPENLKIYTTMKPKKHNQPLALMRGNTCGICGVAQTVAIEREVRQGVKLVNCSNCERILVPV